MLKNIAIKNYKSIKELEIDNLNRINLFVGRNNAGKSNILEAILLYATRFSTANIIEILSLRKDIILDRGIGGRMTTSFSFDNILSLITNRSKKLMRQCGIELKANSETVTMRSYKTEKLEVEGNTYFKYLPFSESEVDANDEDVQEMLRVVIQRDTEETPNFRALNLRRWTDDGVLDTRCIYVNCTSRDSKNFEAMWNQIVLSPLKNEVIRALQLIAPEIEDVACIREIGKSEAMPYVRIKEEKIPLHSMGDGIVHILNIMLAMVNVKDGILLLDEMENGLHFHTLEQLWEIINSLSLQLNVQVFVTTHSNDCIRAFKENAREEGTLYSLHRLNDEISYHRFNFRTIDKIMASTIDIRDYTNDEKVEDEDDHLFL